MKKIAQTVGNIFKSKPIRYTARRPTPKPIRPVTKRPAKKQKYGPVSNGIGVGI